MLITLPVACDNVMALGFQTLGEVGANEATGPGHAYLYDGGQEGGSLTRGKMLGVELKEDSGHSFIPNDTYYQSQSTNRPRTHI